MPWMPVFFRARSALVCNSLFVFALLPCWAASGIAEVSLDCPAQTSLEVKQLHKGVEAYCVLGDGTRHGPWGGWFPDGQRAIEGYYENSRLHGSETEWYSAAELSGWQGLRARLRLPRRRQSEWSRGKLHGEVIDWDIRGRVLQRSTWHRGEFVAYVHPRGTAAQDSQLGRPFAALHKPKGCFDRKYYPSLLQTMMGEPVEGYSGYAILYGTNKNCGREERPCGSYSYAQLSDILGQEIEGFADSARFAVTTCRTREDERRYTAAEELKWRKRSAVHLDPARNRLPLRHARGLVWTFDAYREQHRIE